MIITFIVQVYYDRKENKVKKVVNYLDDVHKYVWTAFGISVLILTIAGGFTNIGYIVLPVLLLLFGLPTFISGCITSFTPMIIGGISCWVLSILAFINKEHNSSHLVVAMGAVLAWIIPGFILRARFNEKRRAIQNYEHGV